MAKLLVLLLPLLLLLLVVVAMGREEMRRNTITHIKGFDGPLPFSLETGYVEVEETHGVHFMYYFIQSERSPAEDPVILWISGGPGCSGLNALFYEIGPLRFDLVSGARRGFPRLVYLEDSWTKVSSVIFLDAPVGAGFSYAREQQGRHNASLTGTSRQLRTFLHKWVAGHPEFASNPLYIGGDSYSGYTVTVTALEIADNGGGELNLVGYMVGNAAVQDEYDYAGKVPFMHGMGLISNELYEAALGSCSSADGEAALNICLSSSRVLMPTPRSAQCRRAQQAVVEAVSDINPLHILEPLCVVREVAAVDYLQQPHLQLLHSRRRLLQVQEEECRETEYRQSYIWAADPEVRETLGVREGSVGSWALCPLLPDFNTDVRSAIPYHRSLTQRGYRALVYNGDHDMCITVAGTQAWIKTLGYPVVTPWRPWYKSNGEVAGFTTEYAHSLTFATVKGAGHMAPQSHPKECLHMLRKWISPAGRL